MNEQTRKLGSKLPHVEVPEDIFQTACGIVMQAKSLKSVSRHTDVVDAIALALKAERLRCFKIADDEQRQWQSTQPRSEYGSGREGGASVIAAMIRGAA